MASGRAELAAIFVALIAFAGCGESALPKPEATRTEICTGDIRDLSYPENTRVLETFYSADTCDGWRAEVPTPTIPWGLPEESPVSELIAKYLLIQTEAGPYDQYSSCALFELADQSDAITTQLRITYDEIPHHQVLPREELTNFLGVMTGQEEVVELLTYIVLDPAPVDPEFLPLVGGEEGARNARSDLQGIGVIALGRSSRIVDGEPDPHWVDGLVKLIVDENTTRGVQFLATAQLRSIGVTASEFSELVGDEVSAEALQDMCDFAFEATQNDAAGVPNSTPR